MPRGLKRQGRGQCVGHGFVRSLIWMLYPRRLLVRCQWFTVIH
ncbi:hypothetical protein PITC_069530 [Penicillium italicum]|uniref:Uncharacterized protein n=1 Tax=Penicillium italicum TaxID=40296 RepID=A0A0A2L724_PENIT|nr:hypothetical protein PITC_069530 [Penicillium italicum]